jgi:prepilin-type N-terminal cleavage/methylation domain-containing protein
MKTVPQSTAQPSSFGFRSSKFKVQGSKFPDSLCAAFTLLEIMIAIGIFSMVLAGIYASWTAILRSSKVGLETAAAVQRARIASRTIEDSLNSAQCFLAHQQRHPEYYGFVAKSGTEGVLSFATRLAQSFPRSGKFYGKDARRVTFSVEPGTDGSSQLVLRQRPLVVEKEDKDETNFPLVLAKNVREFQLQFWDSRLNEWVDEWTQTNLLPKMVMVTLKLADNNRSVKPQEDITRIISVASSSVQPIWQQPTGSRLPTGAPGAPGAPGTPGFPGTQPPVPGTQLPPPAVPPGKFGRQ